MGGILKRTMFVDQSKGYVLWHDYAMVQTALGVMVEPRMPFQRVAHDGQVANFDPTDQIAKVDNIEQIPMAREYAIFRFTDGTDNLHGGVSMPRTGY